MWRGCVSCSTRSRGLVEAWSEDGFTPLHLACFAGGASAVALLVERGAPLETMSRHEQIRVRPLGTAAFARDLESARVLLDAGADPNGGEEGSTALLTAAANGDEELVRLLLERGADRQASLPDGRTAADLAREGGHDAVAALLPRQIGPGTSDNDPASRKMPGRMPRRL